MVKTRWIRVLLAGLLCVTASVRAGRYSLGRYTIDADATISSSPHYMIDGVIGQRETGVTNSPVYLLIGGFLTDGSLCIVDFEHFAAFASHWLDGPCTESNDWCGGADLNQVNDVDIEDLTILASTWLEVCPISWPFH